jgi:hypothetical protein
MSRKAFEAAHDFIANRLDWPELRGPFFIGPLEEESSQAKLHCHLTGTIKLKGAIGPQVASELRRLSRLLSDQAAAVAKEWANVVARRPPQI